MSFSLLELFKAGAANADRLRDTLLTARAAIVAKQQQFPDLSAQLNDELAKLDELLAALDEPLSEQAIANLAVAVLPEALNIIKGKVEPKSHAGDSV